MPNFKYNIIRDGRRESGTLGAANRTEAAARLRGLGATVLKLEETTEAATKMDGLGKARLPGWLVGALISRSQVELSFRQLSSILRADVPILSGLDTVGEQCSTLLGDAYGRIRERVRQGGALSGALHDEAPFIGRVSLGLVRVGEANGTLDDMLAYAADLMERARRLKNELLQAFSYPVFVIVVGIGVAWFMATKVLPKILDFIQARQGKDAGLPPVTQALLEVTAFLQNYGWYMLATPVVLTVFLLFARRRASTGESVDQMLLSVPLLGGAFKAHANTMWCRTLSALLHSGVGIVEALELVEQSLGNWHFAAQFRKMREDVRQGRSLTRAMDGTVLPKLCPMARSMVATSEQSGGMDAALAQVADYYEDVLQRRVKLLSKLVEPAMYAVVGGMVAFVYFAFFMAMMAAQRSSF